MLLGEALTVDLIEAKRIKTSNPSHGFYGNADVPGHMSRDGVYRRTHQQIQRCVRQPAKVVQHYLDSPHGRLLAKSGKADDVEYVRADFKKFKARYTPELFKEDDGVTDLATLLSETDGIVEAYDDPHYGTKAGKNATVWQATGKRGQRALEGKKIGVHLKDGSKTVGWVYGDSRAELMPHIKKHIGEEVINEAIPRPNAPADNKKADIAGGSYTPTTKNMARFIKKMPVMRSEFGAPAVQDDKIFNASNIKTFDRKKNRMGYNPGDDVKAWVEEYSDEPDDELLVMITELATQARGKDDETFIAQIAALLDVLTARKAD